MIDHPFEISIDDFILSVHNFSFNENIAIFLAGKVILEMPINQSIIRDFVGVERRHPKLRFFLHL